MLYSRPRQGGDVPSVAHLTGQFTLSGTSGFCFVSGPPGQPEIDRIYWSSVGDYSGWTVVRNIRSCWYPRFNAVGLTGLETVYVAPAGGPVGIGDERPFDGARFVCTDNQFLYFFDYSFTTPTFFTGATFQVKLQKLDLANYANVTTLATFHQQVNVDSISNLIYHPTTDSLWAVTYQGVPSGSPNTGEVDRLVEINKNTGAVTVRYETFVDFNAAGIDGLQVFNPMTYTPDAIWGVAYATTGFPYSFRWDLETSTMSFGLQGLRPESAGVGLRTGDLRVRVGTNVNAGETIVHPGYTTEPVHPSRRSFSRLFGAGTANLDWSRVLAPTTNLRPFGQYNQIWEWDDYREFEEELVAPTPIAGTAFGGGDLFRPFFETNGYEPVGFDGDYIYAAGEFTFPTGAPSLITGDTSNFAGGIGDWTNVSYYGTFGNPGPAHATGPLTVVDGPTPGSKAMRCEAGGPSSVMGAAMTVPVVATLGDNLSVRATFRLEGLGEPPHYTDVDYGEWVVHIGVRTFQAGVQYAFGYSYQQISRGAVDADDWFTTQFTLQVPTLPAGTWSYELLFAVSAGSVNAEAQVPGGALVVADIEMRPSTRATGIARFDFPSLSNMTPYYHDPTVLPHSTIDIVSPTTDPELGLLYFLEGDFESQKIMKYDLSQGPGGTPELLYQFPDYEYNGPIVCNTTDHRIYTPVGGSPIDGMDFQDRLVSFGPDGSRTDEFSAITYSPYTPHVTPHASFDPPLWSMTTTEDAVWGVYVPVGQGLRGSLFRWDINRKQMSMFDPRTTPAPFIPYCLGLPDGSCLFIYQNDDLGVTTDTDLIDPGRDNPTITQFRAIPVVDEFDNVTLEVKIADQTNAADGTFYWTLDGYANAPAPDYSYSWYYNSDSIFRIPGRSGWAWNSYWLG
jgi:hypothetical protein